MGTGATLKVGASNSEFNKAMKDMVSDMKNVKSEFTLASTQAKLFGTETDSLKAKQTQLTSALKIQNDMVKNYDTQLKTIVQNIESLKTKQADLATKIETTTAKYKESVAETGKDSEASKALKAELDGLNESYAKLDKSIDSNNNKINTVTQKMNSTKASLLENNKALEETNNKLKTASLDEFSNKMEKVSNKSGEMANKLVPASTAVAGIGVASAKASVDFEESMTKVFTIADETEVSYGDMKKAIMDLSSQTGISADEIADNVYEAISSGQSTGDAVNFVSNATKLATAGFTDSGKSLDVLTSIMNSYGLESSEVTNISDKLITTQNVGKVTVDELASSMGKVIPTAKAAGVSLDDVCTAYSITTSKGIDCAESTTYINSMINELAKSGTTASKALQSYSGQTFQQMIASGKSLGDILGVMADGAQKSGLSMTDLFASQEGAKAAMVLSTNAGSDFNDVLGQMKDSAGATETAFEKMDNTSGAKLKKSFNDLKISAINMGDALAPVTTGVAEGFKNITTWLSNLSEGQMKAIATAGGLLLGITGILTIISKVTSGISSLITVGKGVSSAFTFIKEIQTLGLTAKLPTLASGLTKVGTVAKTLFSTVTTFFMANPILAGITIAIGLIVLLYTKCEWFRNGVNAIGEWLKNFFTVTIPQAFNSIVAWFASLPAKASALWTTMKTAFSTGWNSIATFFASTLLIFFSSLWVKITQTFTNGWNAIVTFFTVSIPAWIGSVAAWFATLPGKIGYAIGFVLGTLATWAVNIVTWIATNVPIWIDNITNFFAELPGKIWTWLVNVVTNLTTWGSNIVTWITTNVPVWIDNITNFFAELPGKIWTWLVNVVTNLTTWGTNVVTWISTNVSVWITNIVNYFSQLPGQIWSWLVEVVNKVVQWGSDMLTKAKEEMGKVYDGIVDTFTTLPAKMLDIGTNIVKGMWEGIKNSADWLMDKISDFADSVIDGFKDSFDIHSPSRIMRDLIGRNLVSGISVGVDLETPNLQKNIDANMEGVITNLKSTVDINTSSASSTGTTGTNDTTNVTTGLINKILDKMDTLADALDISIDGQSLISYTNNNLAISSKRVR